MRLTVSEATRHFSAVLGRVAAGEEIEVVRDGAPVAVIAPPRQSVSTQPIRDLFGAAPAGDGSFADDLRVLQAELEVPPDAWNS
jgi:prevent-host-death family protein